ncbi:MAG: c-type cytochrome [Acidobacteria bacterium]|nr:c-type cytochrome [Acidobacteriota bacterium]
MSVGTGRVLRMAYLVASVAGVGFFALSVVLLGYWPKQVLDAQTRAMGPEFVLELTPSATRGRAVYAREGCAYCHTQQIRYLASDHARFGAPTLAWETRRDYPHLWGTRRIGPDLSRAAGTRPDDWQLAHLFAPRALVAQSVMPAYTSLFDGAPDRPRQEARDLVAYLNTLGRARELAGAEGESRAQQACNCADDEMAQMAFHGSLNTHPAQARRTREAPMLPDAGDLPRGQRLYAARCASCHGPRGEGDGPGAVALLPAPTNVTEHEYASARIGAALWNGVAGTAMPAWRDYSPEDLAALVAAVRALSAPGTEAELPAGLLERGRQTYREHCVQCHGERGDGAGPAAAELTIAPADLTSGRATLARTVATLRSGIPGTPMAPWTARLANADLIAVAHYVRSLYEPAAGAAR